MILHATERVIPQPGTTTEGHIEWDAPKSLGWFLHAAGTVAALPLICATGINGKASARPIPRTPQASGATPGGRCIADTP